MLKIVVFDSGYGGELFADKLEEELGVVEIIRVIDWRNADKYLYKKRQARRTAEKALRPYIGKVDLIIFANFFLTLTSLKFFRRKYRSQKFIGLDLVLPSTFIDRNTIILTTNAVSKTAKYRSYLLKLHRRAITMALDDWPNKIDDGELANEDIRDIMLELVVTKKFFPKEIILACSQFNDIKPALREIFNSNIKIHDSFNDLYHDTCKTLRIRGAIRKQK
ncbi:hypothetical protein IKD57_03360 [Candidatus Saccharibacteria bacterium]|nr:hypothetical protein [Candidatus Saccharibacteria bacterium]